MVDEIDFVPPVGVLGRAVDRLILANYIRSLIEERNAAVAQEAEARSSDAS